MTLETKIAKIDSVVRELAIQQEKINKELDFSGDTYGKCDND